MKNSNEIEEDLPDLSSIVSKMEADRHLTTQKLVESPAVCDWVSRCSGVSCLRCWASGGAKTARIEYLTKLVKEG